MFEDFGQYNLDRLNTKEIKSQDVIKKHSLDPTLEEDPIMKANLILSSGDELQKTSVIINLPTLFKINSAECFKLLVPKMQQCLPGSSPDFHILASTAIRSLLQDHIISPEMFASNFLLTILAAMDSKDYSISTTWSETLFSSIDYLPPRVLQIDILPAIVSKLDVTTPLPIRLCNCRLLKHLIRRFDPSLLKRDLVSLVVSLCQDVSSEIRAAGCGPLASLAVAGGPEILKSHLMNALVDIVSDETPMVRLASFPALITICPIMPLDMLKNTGIPMISKFMKIAFRVNENLTAVIAEHYGAMCLAVDRGLIVGEKEEYFIWYQNLVSLGSPHCQINKKPSSIYFDHKISMDKLVEIRHFCSLNFVTMTKFTVIKGEVDKNLSLLLADCFRCLLTDPSPFVRKEIATIFHEVLVFYGKGGGFMKQELNVLLTDSSDDVLESIVPQISQLVDDFVKIGIYKVTKDMGVLEFVSSLMKCESTLSISHRWRTYTSLLSQMEILCRSFNTEAIITNFLPLLWKRLTSIRTVPSRIGVFRFIIVILRMSKKEQVRYEIVNRLINELCLSNSFYNRMLFMRCCPYLNEVFSCSFIKQHFINNILLMANDNVANVRWSFVTYLPNIKGMLIGDDKATIVLLNEIIEKLNFDPDAEVRKQLNSVRSQLSLIDKDKMYPDDKKKFEMEMAHFTIRKEMVSSSSVPSNQPQPVQQSIVRGSPGVPPMRPLGAGTALDRGRTLNSPSILSTASRTTNVSPPNMQAKPRPNRLDPGDTMSTQGSTGSTGNSCLSDLNEKEFLIDAGVKLPVGVKVSRPSRITSLVTTVGTIPVRRSLPGARLSLKRHSTPASSLSSIIDTPIIKNDSNNNNTKHTHKENMIKNKNNKTGSSNDVVNSIKRGNHINKSDHANYDEGARNNIGDSSNSRNNGKCFVKSANSTKDLRHKNNNLDIAGNHKCNNNYKDQNCNVNIKHDTTCNTDINSKINKNKEDNVINNNNEESDNIDKDITTTNTRYKVNNNNKASNIANSSDKESSSLTKRKSIVIHKDTSTNTTGSDEKCSNSDANRRVGVVRRCNGSHLPRPLSLFNMPSNQLRQQNHLPSKHNTTASLASRLPVYRLSDKTVKR